MSAARATFALVALLACAASGEVHATPARAPSASAVGPHDRDAPEGATVVGTFGELAAKVTAPNGPAEIWVRGEVTGDLTVKRPLAIRGARGATLVGTGAGTVLSIEATDVVVENLAVRHSGRRQTTEDAAIRAKGERIRLSDLAITDSLFGISLQECRDCTLERAHVVGPQASDEPEGDGIKVWESHGSTVRGCVVEHVRDVVVWYTRRATLEDNVVRNGRYGTHFMYAHDSVARRSRLEGNTVGIFVMYSQRMTIEDNVLAGARGTAGMGLGFKDSDAARVRGNWIVANTTGTYLDDTPRTPEEPVVFEGNVFAIDEVALRLHGVGKGLVVRGNDFRDDATTIEVDGGGDALACDVSGNHFSDYEGYDLNGDGIGDVPFRVNALSSELSDRRPSLKFFKGTAAMQIIDALAHAMPVLESKTLLVDPEPLVRPPEVTLP